MKVSGSIPQKIHNVRNLYDSVQNAVLWPESQWGPTLHGLT